MSEIELLRTIQSFTRFIILMLVISLTAFILQFISNIIIIKKLPKINENTEKQINHLNDIQLQNREIGYKIDRIEKEIKK